MYIAFLRTLTAHLQQAHLRHTAGSFSTLGHLRSLEAVGVEPLRLFTRLHRVTFPRNPGERQNCSLFRSQPGAKENCSFYYSLDGKYFTASGESDSAVLEDRVITR